METCKDCSLEFDAINLGTNKCPLCFVKRSKETPKVSLQEAIETYTKKISECEEEYRRIRKEAPEILYQACPHIWSITEVHEGQMGHSYGRTRYACRKPEYRSDEEAKLVSSSTVGGESLAELIRTEVKLIAKEMEKKQ